jgi:hypothetical protein
MGKTKKSWPSWAPASLVQVYEELSRAPDADWILREDRDLLLFRMHDGDPGAAPGVFVGIGDKKKTLGVVRSICADQRMQVPWTRLQRATEAAASAPNPGWVNLAGATDLQVLAVQVALRTIQVSSQKNDGISRTEWMGRLTEIAEHARVLADLIENNCSLVEDMDRLGKHYFTDAEWDDACEELAMESAAWGLEPPTVEEEAREERRFEARRNGLEPEPYTEEEIARDAEFEAEIKGWTDWYRGKLDRAMHFLSVSGALRILHEGTSRIAQNPPFVLKGTEDVRQLARLSHTLSHFLMATFGSPLDDVVATIAEVTTGQEVSTDSVKMRRKRVRDYYRKGAK